MTSKTAGRLRRRNSDAGERQVLFAAALEDQQLFESLAAEEPLRELLQDPAAKAQLLRPLDDPARALVSAIPAPGLWASLRGAAMVVMAVFVRYQPPKPEPVVVAETRREPVRSFPAAVAGGESRRFRQRCLRRHNCQRRPHLRRQWT